MLDDKLTGEDWREDRGTKLEDEAVKEMVVESDLNRPKGNIQRSVVVDIDES
jgi:hypothetical protein